MVRVLTDKIKKIAEKQGLDAPRLAKKTNISQATVYRIWNGMTDDPGIQTLGEIAAVLGVHVCDIIEDDGKIMDKIIDLAYMPMV